MVLALTWLTATPSLRCVNSQRLVWLERPLPPLRAPLSLGPGSDQAALVLFAPFNTRVESPIRLSLSNGSWIALTSFIPAPGTCSHSLLPVVASSALRIRPPAFFGLTLRFVTGSLPTPLSVHTWPLVSTMSTYPKPGLFGLTIPLSPRLPLSARMALALTRPLLANGSRMALSPLVTLLAIPPLLPKHWLSVFNLIHPVVAYRCTLGDGDACYLHNSRGLSALTALRMVLVRAALPSGMYHVTPTSSVRCVKHGWLACAVMTWFPASSLASTPTLSSPPFLPQSFSLSSLTSGAGWVLLPILSGLNYCMSIPANLFASTCGMPSR